MMLRLTLKIALIAVFISLPLRLQAQSLSSEYYTIGSPSVTDYYVDPANGKDTQSGTARTLPKKTVTAVWNLIADNTTLTRGYRINLLPGTYTESHLPNYWELKKGTASAPIILQAADGYGTVFFTRDINMATTSYFYLIGIDITNRTTGGYGDAFHCERCDHILLRGNSFNGAPAGRAAGGDVAHETIKFNQSSYVYIENNNIQGADDNGIDWVAVQYGHIRGNRIHDTAGWCTYVKGGSSYILIESNIAYDCGEGGITAGQGTGFEFMQSPWLQFEANYIKIVNNIIYNITGAALGVNGGYNILVAHNTAYRVGTRSHLLEVVFGERSCDGDTTTCAQYQAAQGWGPTATGSDNNQYIGNSGVLIYNNVFYNPAGISSGSQHFAIQGPRTPTAPGIPSPQRTDIGLEIKGNIIWNGSSSMPLGIEESSQGCQSSNVSCNQAQLVADNSINTTEPSFVNPGGGDFRPVSGSALESTTSRTVPDLAGVDTTLTAIAEGDRGSTVTREFSGATRTSRPPGAIASAASSITIPSSGSSDMTPSPESPTNQAPQVSSVKASGKNVKSKIRITISATASDDSGIASVVGYVKSGKKSAGMVTLSVQNNGKYTGTISVSKKLKNLKVSVVASDSANSTGSKSASVKVR
jgi:hypothetical protein